ncbi:DinB family protein [Spirosoma endbachense]|uniref:Damage-inducible protein DinB n=1 Tax=Spirosoma endbachense TaxID=2666025 RepID=A0A6P1VS37_9BACT|nr:DinB family protein [Spirosoma endbachense]QHV95505.1 hypothetical protein GJR95_11050 [Spirosoma endbachense]
MDHYKSLIKYNIQSNQRVLAQLRDFPQHEFEKELGGSFPSLKLTIRHLLESDWIWLKRWQGEPLATLPTHWETNAVESIQAIWEPIQDDIDAYFSVCLPDQLERSVRFTTKKGDTFALLLWQTINHVVNHGTYHRGQITNMVRMLGYQPVVTELFLFFNENNRVEQSNTLS